MLGGNFCFVRGWRALGNVVAGVPCEAFQQAHGYQ
jgi:hypothetical protein